MLLLAGAGPSTATFPAHLNGVPHQFLGVVPHERMASLFSAVDATILPSTREAMPLACLESLACGTPVVATRVGRLPEIVKSGANGFLADGDPSSLARAIDEAIHGSNWMRERCRASVANFGWDRVGPSLMLVYREVLQ
jgi:D-inositol-3-phosphate glycosyltransferase